MMPRVFRKESLSIGASLIITGEDGHHFARVLRVRCGEEVAVATPGGTYLAVVQQVFGEEASVTVQIISSLPSHEPQQQVFLLQGLPKGDKLELIIQKCTAVGVAEVLLLKTKRSVVQLDAKKATAKIRRWERIALEAASQAQRDSVPAIHYFDAVGDLERFMASFGKVRVLLLDEAEQVQGIRSAVQGIQSEAENGPIVVAVGPEGGWDDDERIWWHNVMGARSVSLGPRILRTETAGVVAVTAVLYEFGELGG